jgi:hypothetical protein
MAPPDRLDDEFIRQLAVEVAVLYMAVVRGTPEEVVGHIALLVNLMIEHRDAPIERASDEPLRRALARL